MKINQHQKCTATVTQQESTSSIEMLSGILSKTKSTIQCIRYTLIVITVILIFKLRLLEWSWCWWCLFVELLATVTLNVSLPDRCYCFWRAPASSLASWTLRAFLNTSGVILSQVPKAIIHESIKGFMRFLKEQAFCHSNRQFLKTNLWPNFWRNNGFNPSRLIGRLCS